MLMGALATFTLVALMGLVMVRDAWRGYAIDPMYPPLHAGAALVGSGLVLAAALAGDTRLYANIGLAVVIILLGVVMGIASKRGKKVSRAILLAHGGLAVACYGLLAFFTLFPHAVLY